MRPFVVGLGRSGAGLHAASLLRAGAAGDAWFAGPPLALDPRPEAGARLDGVLRVDSPEHAASISDPAATVVHLCTPPSRRVAVLGELAALGFTRVLVEKPLAADRAQLDRLDALRRRHDLHIEVVSHWLSARLTHELAALVAAGEWGPLRSVSFHQDKPRLLRGQSDDGHPSAFDVEIPHALGVALRLAGPATVTRAGCQDLRTETASRPLMGGAWLTLRHDNGVTSELRSDLTAPIQRRSVRLRFADGEAVGHYPISERDDHARLTVTGREPAIFRDDALAAFLRDTYRHFATGRRVTYPVHHAVVRLLCEAKARAAIPTGSPSLEALP
ncbi:Predicted dehydrogenase [Streptomyces zhaozhouensis]|uniref:Predicted dehydrogenase n=1 Tax=Streptomyces zhaozhouensis TaxID=1300267 RepID=A0A286DXM2_9ACTN|nr:Gfo/Idh/MocA family oxidoreductase [Streptomyces zhaozhouensis]SOD63380.1 Predicted dehydrogenase [Streptomyces zhaozhouensis]